MMEYGVMHVVILVAVIYQWGLVNGVIVLVVGAKVVGQLVKVFGYEFLSMSDLTLVNEPDGVNHNLVAYFEMGMLEYEVFKREICKRGIEKIAKLRKKRVNIYGFYLWKTVSVKQTEQQIQPVQRRIENDSHCLEH